MEPPVVAQQRARRRPHPPPVVGLDLHGPAGNGAGAAAHSTPPRGATGFESISAASPASPQARPHVAADTTAGVHQRLQPPAAAAYLRSPSVAEIGAALSGLYSGGGGAGDVGAFGVLTASPSQASTQPPLRPSRSPTAASRPPLPRPRVSPVTSPGKRGTAVSAAGAAAAGGGGGDGATAVRTLFTGAADLSGSGDHLQSSSSPPPPPGAAATASAAAPPPVSLLADHAPTVSQLKRRLLLARSASKAWAAGDVPGAVGKLTRTLAAAAAAGPAPAVSPADAEAALAVALGVLQRGGRQLGAATPAPSAAPAACRSAGDAAALVPLLAQTLHAAAASSGGGGGSGRLEVTTADAAAAAAALATTFVTHAHGVSAVLLLGGTASAAPSGHHGLGSAPRSPLPHAAPMDAAVAAALLAGWDEAERTASRLVGAALSPVAQQHRRSGGGASAQSPERELSALVQWVREYRAWRTGVRVVATI
jgi:hypothetical protein